VQVLLLEPDRWRYLGLSQVLKSEAGIRFLGIDDHRKIVTLIDPPPDLKPDVLIVSHSLLVELRLITLDRLRKLFPSSNLLIYGYESALDRIAEFLRAGARGYFLLTSEPSNLIKALSVVARGEIWAPRDAVALVNRRVPAEPMTAVEIAILNFLEDGLSNKEIALRLGVAAVTVKAHLTKLYRRFGVRTRLELLAYAMTHRLLGDRPSTRSA
jgi:two-component system, NarL family, response regulator NreC